MLVQEGEDLVPARAFADGDELVLPGHGEAHRLVPARLEAQVARGDDSDDALTLDHRDARDPAPAGEVDDLPDRRIGGDRDRIPHDSALELLHPAHLVGLNGRWQVAVHDADAALLREGDGEAGFGHHVHRRRHDGDAEGDPGGKNGREIGVAGKDLRVPGRKHHIVEGECLFDVSHRHLVLRESPAGRWTRSLS